MADHYGNADSLMEMIADKNKGHDSSSSDGDDDHHEPSRIKSNIFRLFGTKKPVHKVLGGGKPANVFLWRNKKISAAVLGGATVIWILFELLEYHLITLVCHVWILGLSGLFLWSNAATFLNKSPPEIPQIVLPEKCVLQVASALRIQVSRALVALHDVALGKDLKQFLAVIAGLWIFSIIGSYVTFVTFFYISIILLHTLPLVYEKYEDEIDLFAEKAMIEMKKQYAVFDAKVMSKIPMGSLKDKKKD